MSEAATAHKDLLEKKLCVDMLAQTQLHFCLQLQIAVKQPCAPHSDISLPTLFLIHLVFQSFTVLSPTLFQIHLQTISVAIKLMYLLAWDLGDLTDEFVCFSPSFVNIQYYPFPFQNQFD